ncbi:kinase-like domain-containing protein [Crepidotus variabilis]|uniref:Kinase-like domain-containing protein n=1 Tax=Crepidotus variabilis TaxID=179855 RepID=A0A9P6ECA9_9AGAR|nr:kinase-like domain-containing protein [Crepidotus variabilis]
MVQMSKCPPDIPLKANDANQKSLHKNCDRNSRSSHVLAAATRKVNNSNLIKGSLTLGVGSTGRVYQAVDMSTGLLMAVKQINLELSIKHEFARKTNHAEEQKSRKSRRMSLATAMGLEREITERLVKCVHQNIVRYLRTSWDEKSDFEFLNIFTEYISGCSISTILSKGGALGEPRAKNFTSQILQGLEYLHMRGIIHGNIKGSNILVDASGGVKISSFGILDFKEVDDRSCAIFSMAPEIVKRSAIVTQKADIWSIGWLVIEMLSGKHIWDLIPMQPILQTGSGSTAPTNDDIEISAEAQEFLELVIQIEQEARPRADELQFHFWLVDRSKVEKDN